MKNVPTEEDLLKAEKYALSKLCTEIPKKYGRALTKWNNVTSQCQITESGCAPNERNPISQVRFTSGGAYKDFSLHDRMYGKFWEVLTPDHYVMKTTNTSNNRAMCSRANFLLYQWCEYPRTRGEAGKRIAGVTNVEKFRYNIRNGRETCTIPKEYCDEKGVSYSRENQECRVPIGQKIGEFLSSKQLLRDIRASDRRLKTHIVVYKKDFAGKGVNLYTYKWNKVAKDLYGKMGYDIGFLANEVDRKYVHIDINGYKHIDTSNIPIDNKMMQKVKTFFAMKEYCEQILKKNNTYI